MTFVISWTFFAIIWWTLAKINGDIELNSQEFENRHEGYMNLQSFSVNANKSEEGNEQVFSSRTLVGLFQSFFPNNNFHHKKCLAMIDSLGAAMLFSIETQQTIGFGYRYPTENCIAITSIILIFQSVCGVIIQALMTGKHHA